MMGVFHTMSDVGVNLSQSLAARVNQDLEGAGVATAQLNTT
jgi:hypothetical protein